MGHKFRYSVSEAEVARFIAENSCVHDFLARYEEDGVTYGEKAVGIARFFRWLKVVKSLELAPSEFLDLHLQKRNTVSIEERRWALKLALDYSRGNPDLKGKATSYVYSSFFLPVKLFCDAHEAPLTTTNGFFPKKGHRKYPEKPFTAQFIRRALAVLGQRDRAVCMTELQSGQSIKQVLVDVNKQARYIFREIDAGKQRIRLDFSERKGNNFQYFSFISVDTIQEIQKWRPIRQQILKNLGVDSEYLFITDSGKPLTPKLFHTLIRLKFIHHGLYKGPLSMRSHGFRKFFEQEASPPERGISKGYITFMMGHSSGKDSNGVQVSHPLDTVGGTYDKAPKVYPDAVEKEYAKLEQWINIYSGRPAEGVTAMSPDQQRTFELLGKVLEKHPDKAEKFERFLMDL